MTSGRSAQLPRDPAGPGRVGLLELFFDLVYVVALALVSDNLVTNLRWSGVFQTAVLLMALWWVWVVTAMVTNVYDPDTPPIKVLTIAVMFGSLLMATTVPTAFGAHGLLFAGAYVAIHLGRGSFLVPALRGEEVYGRALRIFIWFAISAVPWVIGGVVQGTARGVCWALAVLIDYTVYRLGYPTPVLGAVPATQYNVVPKHLAERYQQIFMIALGELILVSGLTFARSPLRPGHLVAFAVAFATTALLWRIYVERAGALLPDAIAMGVSPRLITRMPYTQVLMVAGAVVTASGAELVIGQPAARAGPGPIGIVLGGPALFLLGRMRFGYEVFGRVSWSLAIGLLVLVAVGPALVALPMVAATCTVAAVLTGITVTDTVRRGHRPLDQPSPPR